MVQELLAAGSLNFDSWVLSTDYLHFSNHCCQWFVERKATSDDVQRLAYSHFVIPAPVAPHHFYLVSSAFEPPWEIVPTASALWLTLPSSFDRQETHSRSLLQNYLLHHSHTEFSVSYPSGPLVQISREVHSPNLAWNFGIWILSDVIPACSLGHC